MLLGLVVIQFIRPERNSSGDESKNITTVFPVPAEVKNILQSSCNDCHSNKTVYPWYTNIQPVGWWLAHHVDEGRRELNFSEFASYPLKRQYHKLEEILEMVEEDEMPLRSYTLLHGNAVLSAAQKSTLMNWAGGLMDTLEARYPMDSLVQKKG